MKRFNFQNTVLHSITLILAISLTSCVDFNDATLETSVSIQVVQPTDFKSSVDLSNKTVTASLGTTTRSALTNEQGIATFNGITPDIYTFSTSWDMTGDEYKAATGSNEVTSGATVSGSLNSQMVGSNSTLSLPTNVSINRDLVIGKVFFSGSKDNNNRTYLAGKFIELFNQSDDSIDVSGLYIGLGEAESTPAYTLDNLRESFGDSVILLKQIYRIPKNANFKVAPGGTVLIANSAIDHTTNDDLENNLLNADFEVKDVTGKYQNNPSTPSMEVIYNIYTGTSVINMLQNGMVSVVIFRTDEDPKKWEKTYKYGKTSGTEWVVAPTKYILDGVESLRNRTTGFNLEEKRLWNYIDAGYTYINATTGLSGEIIYRKTSKMQNGHKVLVDTNNSTNDFKVSTTIGPRNYDE